MYLSARMVALGENVFVFFPCFRVFTAAGALTRPSGDQLYVIARTVATTAE